MDSYIVRMYRRDAENPENLIGLVETVGEEVKRPFHNASELVAILSESHSHKQTVAKPALRIIEAGKKNPR